ncbi:hypothetical protein Tco_0096711 [Tanacetum coccineum]
MARVWDSYMMQDDSSRSWNETDADDADIRLVYDKEPMVEENEALKKHYKDLYDFIKITKSKEIDNNQQLLLLANKDDSKAQIQERPSNVKQRFASQVDVNNNLSRPVTQHYFPKRIESVFAKPDHMISSSESRNSSKNMPRFSLNDMVDEARKKTHKNDRNSKTSVMPSARFQSTDNDSKPKPRSTNHSTRSLLVSKSGCVTITDIITRHRFSPNKTSAVYEKTSPRSDLRWKPTGRIFKTVGLRWVPTGKILASCTSKDDSEPTHGSNIDIPNIYECKQTLDLSIGKSQSMVSFSLIEC